MTDESKIKYVREHLTSAALLEQLAEECTELAQAALKLARIHRGENPTPVHMAEAVDELCEEVADVMLCKAVEAFDDDKLLSIEREKLDRWVERLGEKYCEEDAED